MIGMSVTVYLNIGGQLAKREFPCIKTMSQLNSTEDLLTITHEDGNTISVFNMSHVCEVEVRMVKR